jgi:hypothetical protein
MGELSFAKTRRGLKGYIMFDLRQLTYGKWMELPQDRVQCRSLAMLNLLFCYHTVSQYDCEKLLMTLEFHPKTDTES